MQKSLSIECDNCGAKVPAGTTHGTFTCEYCGHRFRIEPPDAPRPQRQVRPQQLQANVARTLAHARKTGMVITVVSLVIVLGGGIVAWLVTSATVRTVTSAVSGGSMKVRTAGGKTLTMTRGKRVLWDNVGGPPVTVKIAGTEHVVGRIRDMENNGQLSIRVYESATLKLRFRTPDLGTYSEAYRAVRHAVVADRLLATDKRNTLHVYDIKDGKELRTHALTDRADQICPMPDGTKVWVQVTDKRNFLFDAQSFATEEAKRRPAHCPRSVFMARHAPPRLRGGGAPRVEGFKPKRLFVDGDDAVVYGAKSPGTPLPTAVAFDPRTKQVRWNKPVVQADPTSYRTSFEKFLGGLAKGRFVTVYGVGTDAWHVGALDARTGDPLWDVTLRNIFAVDSINGFQVTPGFVYVVRTSSLDVLKAKDGKLVGAIGNETYED